MKKRLHKSDVQRISGHICDWLDAHPGVSLSGIFRDSGLRIGNGLTYRKMRYFPERYLAALEMALCGIKRYVPCGIRLGSGQGFTVGTDGLHVEGWLLQKILGTNNPDEVVEAFKKRFELSKEELGEEERTWSWHKEEEPVKKKAKKKKVVVKKRRQKLSAGELLQKMDQAGLSESAKASMGITKPKVSPIEPISEEGVAWAKEGDGLMVSPESKDAPFSNTPVVEEFKMPVGPAIELSRDILMRPPENEMSAEKYQEENEFKTGGFNHELWNQSLEEELKDLDRLEKNILSEKESTLPPGKELHPEQDRFPGRYADEGMIDYKLRMAEK